MITSRPSPQIALGRVTLLAGLAAITFPSMAQASDPVAPSVSFAPWSGTSVRIAEEDKRFVGTFSVRRPIAPHDKNSHLRVDGHFSAPLDARTREAAFIEANQIVSGFSANLFLGWDNRLSVQGDIARREREEHTRKQQKKHIENLKAKLHAAQAARASAESERVKMQGALDEVVKAKEAELRDLTELFNQQGEVYTQILAECSTKYGTGCTFDESGKISIGGKPPLDVADVLAQLCEDSGARMRPTFCAGLARLTEDMKSEDTKIANKMAQINDLDDRERTLTKSVEFAEHSLKRTVNEIDELERVIERAPEVAAEERLNLTRRADERNPRDGERRGYALHYAVGGEIGGHFDRMRVLLRENAAALPASEGDGLTPVTDWSLSIGARADIFVGVQTVFTFRAGATGEHDVHTGGVGLGDGRICSELGPTMGPSVQECSSVRLANALGKETWKGYLRGSYTFYARKLLPTKPSEQGSGDSADSEDSLVRESGGVVPGVEAMLGVEDIGAGAKARLRATAFITPMGDPEKVKVAGRFGLGLETLFALQEQDGKKIGSLVKLTPFAMVGANF